LTPHLSLDSLAAGDSPAYFIDLGEGPDCKSSNVICASSMKFVKKLPRLKNRRRNVRQKNLQI